MNSINIDNLLKSLDIDDFISKEVCNSNLDIEFVYSSNFKNAKILRSFIEALCLKLGFPHKYISRFILIVDELNNNAIEYGTEPGGNNKLRVKTVNKGDSIDIIIEVEDTGKGDKHKTALEMETLRAHQLKLGYGHHESIRGRGLFMIIVKSVDRLYFKDTDLGGLTVGILKNVKK